MKKIFFISFITYSFSLFSQIEMKYNPNSENLPKWVQLMYSENSDEGEVINAYNDYYKKEELIKNKHTQSYFLHKWTSSSSASTHATTKHLKNNIWVYSTHTTMSMSKTTTSTTLIDLL